MLMKSLTVPSIREISTGLKHKGHQQNSFSRRHLPDFSNRNVEGSVEQCLREEQRQRQKQMKLQKTIEIVSKEIYGRRKQNDIFITKYYKYWNKTWINWLSRGILEVWVRINGLKHKLLTNLKYRQEIDGEMKSVSGACGQSPHQQLHHSQRTATGIRMKNYSETKWLKTPQIWQRTYA